MGGSGAGRSRMSRAEQVITFDWSEASFSLSALGRKLKIHRMECLP